MPMSLIATTTLESKSGYAQTIESAGHHLTADESVAAGGTNTGPAPYGLLLASLGACTSITLRMYADRKGWALGEIHVSLRLRRSAEGGDQIERDIRFGAALTPEQVTRLGEIAEKTPVTKTIKAGAAIQTRVL
jgi:putative redox protein